MVNEGYRQFSNKQNRSTFYQMHANLFRSKYLEKCYKIVLIHKKKT